MEQTLEHALTLPQMLWQDAVHALRTAARNQELTQ
jgi:hypothetical protein